VVVVGEGERAEVDHLNTQNRDVGISSSGISVRGGGKARTDFQMGMGANATFFTQKVPSTGYISTHPLSNSRQGARGGDRYGLAIHPERSF